MNNNNNNNNIIIMTMIMIMTMAMKMVIIIIVITIIIIIIIITKINQVSYRLRLPRETLFHHTPNCNNVVSEKWQKEKAK